MKGVLIVAEKKVKAKTKTKKTSTKKHAGGRPSVMTEAVLQKLEFAFLKGLSDREACQLADISMQTLYNYCNKHPEYFERKELLKERPKIQAKLNVADGIESGDIELSKWYLERKARDEFSTKQEVGLTGEVNNPLSGLTTEELKKLLKK